MLCMLTEDNCHNCMGAGLEMLMRYNKERESFLIRTVIGYETWLAALLDTGMQERIHGLENG